MNLKVLFMCGMVALFGSCASDDPENCPEVSTTPKEVNFRINKELATRAGKTEFAEGDAIGIFAVKHGTSDPQSCNVKWVKKDGEWEPATPQDKVLWAQDGADLDFFAYFPYDEEAKDPEAIVFAVNTDVLRAANAEGMNEGEVELSFAHAFAMVEVTITGEGIDFLPELSLQAKNVKANGEWNIVTNAFTCSEDEAASVNFEVEDAENHIFWLVLPAQEIAEEVPFLLCDNGDISYIYTPAEAINLQAGKKQTMTITLK